VAPNGQNLLVLEYKMADGGMLKMVKSQ